MSINVVNITYLWEVHREWNRENCKDSGKVFHGTSHRISFHTLLHIQLKMAYQLAPTFIRIKENINVKLKTKIMANMRIYWCIKTLMPKTLSKVSNVNYISSRKVAVQDMFT